MESGMMSILFYGSLFLYFYMGMYIFSLDTRKRVLRLFFYLCMSLSTWSLTFSLMGHAQDKGLAYGALLSSVWGWGFTYSFLLHLMFLLTSNEVKLKIWQKVLVYLPVPVTLLIFYYEMISGNVASNMIWTLQGWSYERLSLYYFIWIRIYYIFVMSLVLLLLFRRKFSAQRMYTEKEMRFLKTAMVLSMLLGLPKIFGLYEAREWHLLGLGPIHMLPVVLIVCVMLSIREKNLHKGVANLPQRGEFMSVRTHERFFFYVTQAYILAAFVTFGLEVFIKNEDLLRSSILSVMLFVTGFMIFFILKSRLTIEKRDRILFIIMTLTIPFIGFYQINQSETFAWAVPVIFILIAVSFNNIRLLVYTSIMTVFTLAVLWNLRPESQVEFTAADHVGRMVVFGIIIFTAFLINRVYTRRLSQFELQIDHERFVSETARLLSSARNRNLRSNLEVFLERNLEYMEADYGAIYIFPEKKKKLRKAEHYGHHDFTAPVLNTGFSRELETLVEVLLDEKSLYKEAFFTAIKQFIEEKRKEGVTVMINPLVESGKILGIMCMSSFRKNSWDEGYQNTFQLVSASLSSMLYKISKEDELFRMAYYDHLTGLPNRLLYEKIIRKKIYETEENEMLALIFLDLDDFKNINDILGHSAGDRFLIEFARNLKPKLKERDMLSRFGGDEFLIMLPHATSMQEIETFAQEVLEEITKPFLMDGREVKTGASMGISIYPQDGKTGEELIKFADLAMYHAKTTGKNRFTICTEEIKNRFLYEKELEEDLKLALAKNQFVLYYQPKVHGTTEEIIGVEALIRWKHPTKGLLAPGFFLPIAERISLMTEIDNWVFREACSQNKSWQDEGKKKIVMSVNITPVSMMQKNTKNSLVETFRKNQWDPEYIEVEITENTMFFSMEDIQMRLQILKDFGIKIALDDFGTAYSSLSRLHRLPIDKVKIDRQFILNMYKEERGKSLYDGILNLAKSLDLFVTIEGVETREQADYVIAKGCDEIQGFYYYRPMPPEQVGKLLQAETGSFSKGYPAYPK